MSRCVTRINPTLLANTLKSNSNSNSNSNISISKGCTICPQGSQGPAGINGTNGIDGITPTATGGFSAGFVTGEGPLIIDLDGKSQIIPLTQWTIPTSGGYNTLATLNTSTGIATIPTSTHYIVDATIQVNSTIANALVSIGSTSLLQLEFFDITGAASIATNELQTISLTIPIPVVPLSVGALLGTTSLNIHGTYELVAGHQYQLRLVKPGILNLGVSVSIPNSTTASQWSIGQIL